MTHPCNQCEYQATSARQLSRHKAVTHVKNPLSCILCPFVTAYQTNLLRHRREVHGILGSKGNKSCKFCGFEADDNDTLIVHQQQAHQDILKSARERFAREKKSARGNCALNSNSDNSLDEATNDNFVVSNSAGVGGNTMMENNKNLMINNKMMLMNNNNNLMNNNLINNNLLNSMMMNSMFNGNLSATSLKSKLEQNNLTNKLFDLSNFTKDELTNNLLQTSLFNQQQQQQKKNQQQQQQESVSNNSSNNQSVNDEDEDRDFWKESFVDNPTSLMNFNSQFNQQINNSNLTSNFLANFQRNFNDTFKLNTALNCMNGQIDLNNLNNLNNSNQNSLGNFNSLNGLNGLNEIQNFNDLSLLNCLGNNIDLNNLNNLGNLYKNAASFNSTNYPNALSSNESQNDEDEISDCNSRSESRNSKSSNLEINLQPTEDSPEIDSMNNQNFEKSNDDEIVTSISISSGTASNNQDLAPTKIKRQYSCTNCDFKTVNPREFLYHRRDVHNQKVKIVECPNCVYACQYFQKLQRHMLLVHKLKTSIIPPTDINNSSGNVNNSPNNSTNKLLASNFAQQQQSKRKRPNATSTQTSSDLNSNETQNLDVNNDENDKTDDKEINSNVEDKNKTNDETNIDKNDDLSSSSSSSSSSSEIDEENDEEADYENSNDEDDLNDEETNKTERQDDINPLIASKEKPFDYPSQSLFINSKNQQIPPASFEPLQQKTISSTLTLRNLNENLVKVYKCCYCDFVCNTASRFHVHFLQHLNTKPFMCSVCEHRSNWCWDIRKHIRMKSQKGDDHANATPMLIHHSGKRDYRKYDKYLILINKNDIDNDSKQQTDTRGVIDPLNLINANKNLVEQNNLNLLNSLNNLNSLLGTNLSDQMNEPQLNEDKEIDQQQDEDEDYNDESMVITPEINLTIGNETMDLSNVITNQSSMSNNLTNNGQSFINSLTNFNAATSVTNLALNQLNNLKSTTSSPNVKPSKLFYCAYCDYTHRDSKSLVSHLSIHAGKKPFKCRLCGFSSNWREVLNRHVQSRHSGTSADIEQLFKYTVSKYICKIIDEKGQINPGPEITTQATIKQLPVSSGNLSSVNISSPYSTSPQFHSEQQSFINCNNMNNMNNINSSFVPDLLQNNLFMLNSMLAQQFNNNYNPTLNDQSNLARCLSYLSSPNLSSNLTSTNTNLPNLINFSNLSNWANLTNSTNNNLNKTENGLNNLYNLIDDTQKMVNKLRPINTSSTIGASLNSSNNLNVKQTKPIETPEVLAKHGIQGRVSGFKGEFKCDKCPFQAEKAFHMEFHSRHHIKSPRADFKCDHCDYWVNAKKSLVKHVYLHKYKNESDE